MSPKYIVGYDLYMSELDSEKIKLHRIVLKVERGEVRVLEDVFDGHAKGLIYKIIHPENLKGYKLKYVMKTKLNKIVPRPQNDPTVFDHYVVYDDKEKRDELVEKLAGSMENKVVAMRDAFQACVDAIQHFKETKQAKPMDDGKRKLRLVRKEED